MINDLILKNRSYRRFDENHKIEKETLIQLIDLARNSASAANKQPLKYFISTETETNEIIFQNTKWAGYLKDWAGPEKGERPTGYIIILGDKNISDKIDCDHGIAAQSILLGAVEKGLGGCLIGSINRERIRKELKINENFSILIVVALGKPKEKIVIEEFQGSVEYWRDDNDVHHVPKRLLGEIIINK